MQKIYLLVIFLISFFGFSQATNEKIQMYLDKNYSKYDLTDLDVKDWTVQSVQNSNSTKITNYRIVQRYQQIEIYDSQSNVWMKDNEIINLGNRFKKKISEKVNASSPVLSVIQGLTKAYSEVAIANNNDFTISEMISDKSYKLNDGLQDELIFAKLVYQPTSDEKLKLAWSFQFYSPDSKHYWDISIDAINGDLLDKHDLTINCNFHSNNSERSIKNETKECDFDLLANKKALVASAPSGTYRVIPYNYFSPNHHAFQLITTTGNTLASPNGWHNANTIGGTNATYIYTYTRGNNVFAQEDADGNNGAGAKPDGGSSLTFDFLYGGQSTQPTTYTSAAITNLFYMNNIMHDVWYQYGFDEINANFQLNNLGRGGVTSVTGDAVFADAQDGYLNASPSLNNANFSTPHDGSRPRMQMYLWNSGASPSSYLYADSDFDNGVIAHEYGHGISNRLIGGGVAGCMNNAEQMGEGWSDWFSLMMQLKTGDVGTSRRPMGTYVINQSNTGGGIRSYPYSTNMSVNPLTFDSSNVEEPHALGEIWTVVLWDLAWAYIGKYGFDPDIYTGTGGNNKVMRLVLDALKLQTCNTATFISGRDNLIAADQATTGGHDYCLITQVFTRRGMGLNASSGLATDALDQYEDFTDFPAGPNCTLAVNYFNNENMIRVYPNPSNGQFNVRINNYVGKVNMRVVDINGRVVFANNDIDFNIEKSIDLGNVQSGMYILKVSGDNLNYSQKIFKN